MAQIVFNFSKGHKVQKKKESRYKIRFRSYIGVCFFTQEFGFFIIGIDETKSFRFTDNSYKIKNNKKYSAQLFNNKFISIRELKEDKEYFDHIYLPFMAGVICKGNIIHDNLLNIDKFDLIDTTVNWNLPLAKLSIKKYIENYEDNLKYIEEWKKQYII